MTQRIQEDHYEFRKIISGRTRNELQKRITTGSLFRQRGDGKNIRITIPQLNLPHITWGKITEGIGRGQGNPGDQIKPRRDKSNQPGTDPGDGILVDIDMNDVLRLVKDELQLPDLKPKPNQTFEDLRVVYNGLSKIGPRSLLHKKKTLITCMKRLAAMGKLAEKVLLPNLTEAVPILTPINADRRFRQYNEIKIPSSSAVIFFLRDGSGSMDKVKCDVVSDVSYWLSLFISAYYEKTEKVFIWHDTEARELSEKEFYQLRYGGGTYCSSSLKLMSKIIENRFNPNRWNIYGFYFGDGESSTKDNKEFVNLLQSSLGPEVVNTFGQVEILHWGMGDSLKEYIDQHSDELPHIRNVDIPRPSDSSWDQMWTSEEERDREVRRVLRAILGKTQSRRNEE